VLYRRKNSNCFAFWNWRYADYCRLFISYASYIL